jgi:hypothetical protein
LPAIQLRNSYLFEMELGGIGVLWEQRETGERGCEQQRRREPRARHGKPPDSTGTPPAPLVRDHAPAIAVLVRRAFISICAT